MLNKNKVLKIITIPGENCGFGENRELNVFSYKDNGLKYPSLADDMPSEDYEWWVKSSINSCGSNYK